MSGPSLMSRGARPPLWREARFGLEAASLLRDPVFRGDGVLDGRGRPVLLLPGFLAGDASLGLMAGWLKRTGHRPSGAGIRANIDCSGAMVPRLEERLEQLVAEQGMRAAIVGQSRGGSIAKVLARRRPDLVCGLVALGSPHLDPLAIHPIVRLQVEAVSRLGSFGAPGLFTRDCLEGDCCASFWNDLAGPTAEDVMLVSVYSKSDGVVHWRACLDPHAVEHVEIRASHCGMAVSPAAWRAIGDALNLFAQAERRPAKRGRRARPSRVA